MADNRFSRLDELGAPNNYVTPPTEQDLAYTAYFREVCKPTLPRQMQTNERLS